MYEKLFLRFNKSVELIAVSLNVKGVVNPTSNFPINKIYYMCVFWGVADLEYYDQPCARTSNQFFVASAG